MGEAPESCDRDLCFTEMPAHEVRISQPFRMSVTEVTVEQFGGSSRNSKARRNAFPMPQA